MATVTGSLGERTEETRQEEKQLEGTEKPSGRSWRWFYIILALIVAAIVAFNIFRPITVLPRIALSPGFIFTNQAGLPITSEDYRGQLTLFSFNYGGCDEACRPSLDELAALRQALAQQVPADITLTLATISLDPEGDTPADLNNRLNTYEPETGPVQWDFLVGDPIKTRYVVGNGFSLFYEREESENPTDYRVDFDPRYLLVDGWGIIRAEYRTIVPDLETLLRDINLITEEARNSQGAASLAYEAAHLFLCYPR